MQTSPAIPLAQHALFHTSDLDEARERVAQVFCPHRLDMVGRGQMDARHHHVRGRHLSLNYIQYGAKTVISPGVLDTFYLVQIPLSGGAVVRNGGAPVYSHPGLAAVLNPHRDTTMIWEEGTRQILLQIDRKALQHHLVGLTGGVLAQPLTFTGQMDVSGGIGRVLKNMILHMIGEIDAQRLALSTPGLMGRQLELALMSGLLEAVPHNYAPLLGLGGTEASPRLLRLAEAHIAAHLDQPLDLAEIARAARTTPRTLQNAFRKFRDTTPLQYLRDARLARAHQDLLSGDPGQSVTDVATRWGFLHLGRFSQAYKARFGESPNRTLTAARQAKWSD